MAATTPPKKERRPKLRLAEMRAQALEARDMQEGVEVPLEAGIREFVDVDPETGETVTDIVEVNDGETVFLPHPRLMDSERQEAYDRVIRDEDLDQEEFTDDAGNKRLRPKRPLTINGQPAPSAPARVAEAVLGRTEFRRLLTGGGSPNDVMLAWQLITPAEPDPTRAR